MSVMRAEGTGTLELVLGTLELLLDMALEKLELIQVLSDAVRRGKVLLETVALGGVKVTIVDGTWGSEVRWLEKNQWWSPTFSLGQPPW